MSVDPSIRLLVDSLPIMSSGKPRRFRLYCEAYEWTFNRLYKRYHAPTPAMIEAECRRIERVADAIIAHQQANPGEFDFPKRRAREGV